MIFVMLGQEESSSDGILLMRRTQNPLMEMG